MCTLTDTGGSLIEVVVVVSPDLTVTVQGVQSLVVR